MAKLRFLFYNAKIDGHLLDNLIAGYTALFPCNWGTLGYSHAELWFPDEQGSFGYGNVICGQTFSATLRDGCNGTRFQDASITMKHPARWDWIELEVTDEQLALAGQIARQELGKKYDLLGFFGFVIPGLYNPEMMDYCSEVCTYIAWRIGLLWYQQRTISPKRMYKKIAQIKEIQDRRLFE